MKTRFGLGDLLGLLLIALVVSLFTILMGGLGKVWAISFFIAVMVAIVPSIARYIDSHRL